VYKDERVLALPRPKVNVLTLMILISLLTLLTLLFMLILLILLTMLRPLPDPKVDVLSRLRDELAAVALIFLALGT
jgi:hypothetical protein